MDTKYYLFVFCIQFFAYSDILSIIVIIFESLKIADEIILNYGQKRGSEELVLFILTVFLPDYKVLKVFYFWYLVVAENELEKKILESFEVFDHSGKQVVDVREIGTILRSLGKFYRRSKNIKYLLLL